MFPNRTGLFGSSARPGMDVIAGGLNRRPRNPVPNMGVASAMPQPQMQPHHLAQPEQQRPGLGTRLLGEGWENKVGTLGALMAGDQNAVSRYHQQQQAEMQAQRQAAAQQAADLRERSLDRQDFMFEQDYRRNNPAPRAPDAFDRALAGAGIDPASEQGRQMYRNRAEALARDPNDEFVVVPVPGGTYAGPRSGLAEAMGQSGPPARPVGGLRPMGQGGPASAPGGFPGS